MAGLTRSLVMTRIGGKDYPMRTVPQCFTCNSPFRLEIEQALVAGRTYRAIARTLEGRESESGNCPIPDHESIASHYKNGHMPLAPAAQRAIIERRAKDIGKSIEDANAELVDHVVANQTVIQKGFEALASGEIKLSATDLLTAIRIQQSIEASATEGLDTETWMQALVEYMTVAERFIPPHVMQDYGRALANSPVLKAIAAKRAAQEAAEQPKVVIDHDTPEIPQP